MFKGKIKMVIKSGNQKIIIQTIFLYDNLIVFVLFLFQNSYNNNLW